MNYNKNNSFLFVNATKLYQSQAKNSYTKPYPLRFGIMSKYIMKTATNMKEKTELNSYVYDFSVDYNIIDNSNIVNILKYLIKKHNIK